MFLFIFFFKIDLEQQKRSVALKDKQYQALAKKLFVFLAL